MEGGLAGELLAAHGLYGTSAARVEERIRDYFVRRRSVLDERLPLSDLLRRALPQIYEGE